jgi:hypothetical protein
MQQAPLMLLSLWWAAVHLSRQVKGWIVHHWGFLE